MKTLFSDLRTAFFLTFLLVVVCCIAYPVAVWAAGQAFFPAKAGGSLVADQTGAVRGSFLLAQNFASDKYFQPRPSAAGTGYDSTSSSGTNYGPTSAKLANGSHAKDAQGKDVNDPSNFDGIKDLVAAYRASNSLQPSDSVPADAVTRSGSGLDPHISVANAILQSARVAKARHATVGSVNALIPSCTQDRDFGVFGEPGVNVLELNLALDREIPAR
jgi:K+-transporting ATPase ATPase C chain